MRKVVPFIAMVLVLMIGIVAMAIKIAGLYDIYCGGAVCAGAFAGGCMVWIITLSKEGECNDEEDEQN